MGQQSNIWFAAVDPDSVPTPAPGYVAVFVANGLRSTINGVLHKKDSSGVVTAALPDYQYTNEMAQDAIGAMVSNSSTVWLTYDDANNLLTATIPDGAVTTPKIVDGAVTTAKIVDGAVTNPKLGIGAVGSTSIAGNAVQSGHIAAGAVGTTHLANGAVGAAQISGGAVGTSQLAANAVTAGNIVAGAVGSTQLANGAVGSAHLASGAVGSTALATGAVGGTQLATDAVTQIKIADAAVGTAELVDGNVTNAKLAAMAAATFKMRAAGAGSGVPVDGTAAQAKAALAITASDVSGLGTAATMAATAFDAAGAATTAAAAAQANAIAASQPLDADLTAIAALTTTTYGRSLLALADATGNTALLNIATTALKGLMSSADKTKLDSLALSAPVSMQINVTSSGISWSNTPAANLAAWNSLMSTVPDNSTVAFPPGASAYQFSDTLVIPAGKHLRITGSSNQKSIIQTTSATSDIFQVQDWYNEFNGLKFTASVTRTAGAAISSGNNVAVSVSNCDFAGMWDGVVYTGGVNAGNLAVVSNCGFAETRNRGIVLDGTNANTIIDKVVMDGTAGQQAVGLELIQCGSVLVSSSDLIRAVNNLRFNPTSPGGVFSAYFVNTFFDTATAASVRFQGTGFIQRVKFTNCWFSGSVIGCEFASTASTLPTAIDFVSCDIFGNSGRGIYAHGVQDFAVSNCRIAGNTTAGIEVVPSAGSVTKFNLTNNSICPTAGFPGNGIGVNITAGVYGGYAIKNNDVRSNTSGNNIVDAGTVATTDLKIINDNFGHLITGSIGNLTGTAATSGTGNTALLVARVPANAVAAGQVFRFKLFGISSLTGTLTFRVHAGINGTTGDSQIWLSTTSAAQLTNQRAGFDGLLTVRSAGSSGTVQCEALGYAFTALLPTATAAVTTPSLNTAGAWYITLAVACSAGVFTAQHAVVEAL